MQKLPINAKKVKQDGLTNRQTDRPTAQQTDGWTKQAVEKHATKSPRRTFFHMILTNKISNITYQRQHHPMITSTIPRISNIT